MTGRGKFQTRVLGAWVPWGSVCSIHVRGPSRSVTPILGQALKWTCHSVDLYSPHSAPQARCQGSCFAHKAAEAPRNEATGSGPLSLGATGPGFELGAPTRGPAGPLSPRVGHRADTIQRGEDRRVQALTHSSNLWVTLKRDRSHVYKMQI